MEQIDINILRLIGGKLSGNDMIRLCSISQKMRKIGSSFPMSFYWRGQIERDFGIIYKFKDSYQEYLRLKWLKTQKLFIITKRGQNKNTNVLKSVYTSNSLASKASKEYMIDNNQKDITKVYEELNRNDDLTGESRLPNGDVVVIWKCSLNKC